MILLEIGQVDGLTINYIYQIPLEYNHVVVIPIGMYSDWPRLTYLEPKRTTGKDKLI